MPRPGFSQRLGRVQVAASVAMTIKARELRAAGKPVITLTTGEPNFASPPHAIEAAHQAALAGDTKYPPQDGTPRAQGGDPARNSNATPASTTRWTRSASATAASSACSMPSW